MLADTPKVLIKELLKSVDIEINGSRAWDVTVHNEDFYMRVFKQGALGLGDAYVEKWWDCPRLDILFERLLRNNVGEKIHLPLSAKFKTALLTFINVGTIRRSKQVAKKHYDLGNQLFSAMLDKRMIYSCGYWKDAYTLEEAQLAKLELICQKLQLRPGERLLDIGCGWGGLAQYAAENYQVSVVGITISEKQKKYADELCKKLPVSILLKDYRDINEKFDKIVSVGMFEHVGHLNYDTYMKNVEKMLSDEGLFLLHTIGINQTDPLTNEWILKYIFPNSMLPSIAQIGKAAEKRFVMEDWHNFGADYDETLMSWHENFIHHFPSLKHIYDEQFYRMWDYYLLSCAGSFRARVNQVWQIVFSKKGVKGGYVAPR